MAVDEALLESASRDGVCWLRWYRWSEPTVSLGYFQDEEVPAEFQGLAVVKRLSGGGAILHDRELTYSIAIPSSHPRSRDPGTLYGAVHDAIIGVLAKEGVHAHKRGVSGQFESDTFLCFQRGDQNDVVIDGHKILGSAQRRRRGAILQHGSLLLETSAHAPQLPGICDLGYPVKNVQNLSAELSRRVAKILGQFQAVEQYPDATKALAEELCSGRYQRESRSR